MQRVKCVFVGDGLAGATAMIIKYTTGEYLEVYVPTVSVEFIIFVCIMLCGGCLLNMCDCLRKTLHISYSTIVVLYSGDVQGWWAWSMKKST